jgi:hypothetical protein
MVSENLELYNRTGFERKLVWLLTEQINGTMTEQNQNGTTPFFDF